MKQRFTCVSLDFDRTLAFFKNEDGFYAIFTRRGMPLDSVTRTYERLRGEQGFSIDGFLHALSPLFPSLDAAGIKREFETWFASSLTLYEDAPPFLAKLARRSLPVAIVTAGNTSFQEEKVRRMKLSYSHLFVAEPPKTKSEALRTLIGIHGGPIIHVDDSVGELDNIRRAGLRSEEVMTIRMARPGDGAVKMASEFPHEAISSFAELDI